MRGRSSEPTQARLRAGDIRWWQGRAPRGPAAPVPVARHPGVVPRLPALDAGKSFPQVRVVATLPILTAGREYVDDYGILQHLDPMRDVRRHVRGIARPERPFHAADDELHAAAFDDRDLLVVMRMFGHHATAARFNSRH